MNISNRLLAIEQSLGQSVIPLIQSLTDAQPDNEIGTPTADALANLTSYLQTLLGGIRLIREEVQITAAINTLIDTLGGAIGSTVRYRHEAQPIQNPPVEIAPYGSGGGQ